MELKLWLALALAFGSALWATQEATAYSSNFASWYAVADAPWRIQPGVEVRLNLAAVVVSDLIKSNTKVQFTA
ncbi:Uncharacterised protein [uncultured archaeon]|nr:Uncharacterised protein [uncultured archaeon]